MKGEAEQRFTVPVQPRESSSQADTQPAKTACSGGDVTGAVPPQGWCPLPFCGFTCPCPGDFEDAVVRVVHHMRQVNSVKCGYIQSVTAKTPVPTLLYCLYLKNWSVTAYSNIQRKGRHSMRK